MEDWLWRMFDPAGFPSRWHCGTWSPFLGWLHILSDLTIWFAYMGIPSVLLYFVRRRKDVPFLPVFVLFMLFIGSCGLGHLVEAGMFWWPAYRFSGTVKLFTALVSVATLVALVPFTRRALAMPATADLLARLRSASAEHHRSRQELQLTQEQLDAATRASGVGLWDFRTDSDHAYWDTNARTIFGLSPADDVGGWDFLLGFVLPEDRETAATAQQKCLSDGNPFDLRLRIARRDGRIAHIVARGSVIRDAAGRCVRMTGAFFDVTGEVRSREMFRIGIEASPNPKLIVDRSGTIVMANSHAETVFGYAAGTLVGTNVDELVPPEVRPDHGALRQGYFMSPSARPLGDGRDLFGVRRDGSRIPVEIGLTPIDTSEGVLAIASIIDLTQRKQSEALLRGSLAEKEMLLREVHHRVKNNMQVVTSLLSLQLSKVDDPRYREMFLECKARVLAMALIHEKLYATDNLASLDFGDYVRGLARMLVRSHAPQRGDIRLELATQEIALDLQTSIPLGLILNELITNALKHAFPNGQAGTVRVTLEPAADGRCRLEVADDGVGLPPGFDANATQTLGLRIVRGLVRQLDGELVNGSAKGTSFAVLIAWPTGIGTTNGAAAGTQGTNE